MHHTRSSFPTRRAVLGGAAAAAALSACGPDVTAEGSAEGLTAPSGENPSGEITIWDRSGDLYKVFDGVIDGFRKKYPDIVVHHEAVDIDAKLQNTLITGTDVPDGVFLDDAMIGQYADYLWDVSEALSEHTEDISPQKLDAATIDGKLYGVPYDSNPGLLFYNDAALKRAGIEGASIETYDDLLEAARAYRTAVPNSGPIHLERGSFLGQLQLEMFASQMGTSIADRSGKLRLDSDAYRQILGFLDDVRSEGLGTRAEYLDKTDLVELDNGNQVFYPWAMWFDFAPQQLLSETAGDWRAMQLPAWKSGEARSGAMGGSSFILPKEGKNSQLALLFYEFLMFDKLGYSAVWGKSDVYPTGLNTSVPAYLPAANPSSSLFEPVEALGGQDLWEIASEASREIPGGSYIPRWFNASVDYLGANIQLMLDGKLTPEDVIKTSTADIQSNLVDRQ